jgi:hypothetical protein
MKTKIAISIMIFPFMLMSQNKIEKKDNDTLLHEIKFNFSYLLFDKRINLFYERSFKTDKSIGISMLYNPNKSIIYSNPEELDIITFNIKEYNFHALFFARKYFKKSSISNGFYLEGNIGYSFSEFYEEQNNSIRDLKQENGLSIGGTLGYKIINNEGFLFEAMLGTGLNTSTVIYPRFGLLIGKRL